MTFAWNDWQTLLTPAPQWAHLVVATEREIDIAMRMSAPTNVGAIIRMMRGVRCTTKQGLLTEWAAALQFPYYFGVNWDAFEECLNDMDWLPARSYVMALTHADQVLPQGRDLLTFLAILNTAATRWVRTTDEATRQPRLPVSFHVVFHCDPAHEAEIRDRFRSANIALDTLSLQALPL